MPFKFFSKGASKPVPQRVFSRVYFADSTPVSSQWLELAPARDLPCVDAVGKFHQDIMLGGELVTLDGTARGCRVMFMLQLSGRTVTSNVLVGSDSSDDQSLLQMFVATSRQTKLVQQLAPDPGRAFEEVLTTIERPFCVTLLAPVDPDQTDRLLAWQGKWVGARVELSKQSPA